MTPRKIRGAAERMRGYARVKEARSLRTAAERPRRCPEHRPRTAVGELSHRLRRAGRP
ncbi:hypothetical protein ACFYYB_21395 [Streptomyces sp. NPDC002886]|uniref:hypothetical protein n=1 Tax=Streptomyces sp. NPDC002886 TaxID=3364667 RepID=UPI0036796A53